MGREKKVVAAQPPEIISVFFLLQSSAYHLLVLAHAFALRDLF